jgi:hypothetical protein
MEVTDFCTQVLYGGHNCTYNLSIARLSRFLSSVVDPDLEPVGSGITEQELVGFGIIVPAWDPSFANFLQNGPIRF